LLKIYFCRDKIIPEKPGGVKNPAALFSRQFYAIFSVRTIIKNLSWHILKRNVKDSLVSH
jgi:hypothetical protein